jgi:PAS domain S-box-containing protein
MIIPVHSQKAPPSGAGAPGGGDPKFDPLLDSITDGIVSVDRDWRVTYLNTVSERLAGRSRESLLGKELWAELPEFNRPPFTETFREAMASGNTATLTDYYPPTDSWFEVRVFPSNAGLVLILRDITGMRQAEVERLRLLAAERAAREHAEHAADRLKRLEELTAQLSAARTPEEVMSFAVEHIGWAATVERSDHLL